MPRVLRSDFANASVKEERFRPSVREREAVRRIQSERKERRKDKGENYSHHIIKENDGKSVTGEL